MENNSAKPVERGKGSRHKAPQANPLSSRFIGGVRSSCTSASPKPEVDHDQRLGQATRKATDQILWLEFQTLAMPRNSVGQRKWMATRSAKQDPS